MDLQTLRDRFHLPGVLTFDEHNGLTRLHVTTPQAEATLYLQGAHLTHWKPSGQEPVLFLSRQSDFAPGKPIRGGVPLIFPWFGGDSKNRLDGHPGPSHGFARIQEWTLDSARQAGDRFLLTLTLDPTPLSRSVGYSAFHLTLEIALGATLSMALTVHNQDSAPLEYEEAFHTYFSIGDIHEVTVTGLEPTPYIDKIDHFQPKPASHAPLTFTGPTDRVYENTTAPLTIHAGQQRRVIHVEKTNSHTTVTWNPFKPLPDLGESDWHEMVCVETVNAAANVQTLAPGASATMRSVVTLHPEAGA